MNNKAIVEISGVDKTKAAIDSAKRNLQSLGDKVGALPARFGTLGTAIAAAFTAVTIKGAIDTLDKLDDLSEKTGIAVESLSMLRYAGEVTGTPLEAIALSTKKLAASMAEAAGGNKEAAATFKAVGVEVKNADGSLRSQDAVLLDLADRFQGYEDGAAQAALAQRLFGKSGADMIPLLNQGSNGIRALRGEAEALGLVYGGELAKQAAQFNDNIKKLESSAEAAKVQLAGGLLPILNGLVETFIALKREGVVLTAIEQAFLGWSKYLPIVSGIAQAINMIRGGGALTGKPGEDINALMKERERIERSRKFAEGKGLPTKGFDSDLSRVNDLLRLSRVYQATEAAFTGDTGDAMSRRAGRRGAAPVIGGGGGSDKAKADAEREAKEQAKVLAELAGLSGNFAEDWARRNEMFKSGKLTLDQLVDAQGKLLAQQPFMQERAKAEKDLADTREKAAALADKSLGVLIAENEALAASNLTLGEQIEMIGLNEKQVAALTLARMDANISRKEEALIQAKNIEGNEREIEQLERQLNLLRAQRGKTGEKFTKEEGASEAATMRGDFRDAIKAGFQDGKKFIPGFVDALASTLKTRLADALADGLTDGLFGGQGGGKAGGGGFGGFAGFIKGALDPSTWGFGAGGGGFDFAAAGAMDNFLGFASGGDHRGGFRIVGERGPELEVTGPSRIFNAMQTRDILGGAAAGRQGAGGQPVSVTNNYTVGDVATVSRLRAELELSERRTVRAIQAARSRYGD
jgi:hypothetical protein